MTQEQVSEFIGISRSFIAKVETGKKEPGLTFAAAVAEAFQVPVRVGRIVISIHPDMIRAA